MDIHNMKMPFGKFKDRELEQVPKYYLQWLLGNVKMNEALRDAVKAIVKNEVCINGDKSKPWNLNEQVERLFAQRE